MIRSNTLLFDPAPSFTIEPHNIVRKALQKDCDVSPLDAPRDMKACSSLKPPAPSLDIITSWLALDFVGGVRC